MINLIVCIVGYSIAFIVYHKFIDKPLNKLIDKIFTKKKNKI